uniref:PDZ domain-containing protein n=1 Tax=Eutreptiella gymnastica TaxID=73025 RepID=A0A6U8FYZ8_9EUGL
MSAEPRSSDTVAGPPGATTRTTRVPLRYELGPPAPRDPALPPQSPVLATGDEVDPASTGGLPQPAASAAPRLGVVEAREPRVFGTRVTIPVIDPPHSPAPSAGPPTRQGRRLSQWSQYQGANPSTADSMIQTLTLPEQQSRHLLADVPKPRVFSAWNTEVPGDQAVVDAEAKLRQVRPQLGLTIRDDVVEGCLTIADIKPNGPGMDSCLQPGDVLRSIDGDRISDVDQMARTVSELQPGQCISVVVVRGGQDIYTDLTIGAQVSYEEYLLLQRVAARMGTDDDRRRAATINCTTSSIFAWPQTSEQ